MKVIEKIVKLYLPIKGQRKIRAFTAVIVMGLMLLPVYGYYGSDEKDIQEEVSFDDSARTHATGHTVPAEDPFFSIGSDFLVIKTENIDPELVILFNYTRVYIDTNNDQVWDYFFLGNASDEMTIENVDAGARIHSDKPIWYKQLLENNTSFKFIDNARHFWQRVDCGWSCWNEKNEYYDDFNYYSTYSTVPAMGNLDSQYYVYPGTWYITVPENTDVYIDSYGNGTVDRVFKCSPMRRVEITVSNFTYIYSNLSFYLYNSHTIACKSGYDFYLWNTNISKLIVSEDNTTIEVDNNNDGVYDVRYNYNKGIHSSSEQKIGAHIHSDKPINVVQRNYFSNGDHDVIFPDYQSDLLNSGDSMSYLQPSNMMGSDYYGSSGYDSSISNSEYKLDDLMESYIVGSFSNTSYYQDSILGNDLLNDSRGTVGPNQIDDVESLTTFSHIWANKPFSLCKMKMYRKYQWATGTYGQSNGNSYYRKHWYKYYTFYPNLPAAYIYASTSHLPNELEPDTTATMHARVFNPTADTNITNVSVKVTFPDSFNLSSGTTLNVTVKKIFLSNDTVIAFDTESITPTKSGGNYTFTLNKTTFSDTFDYLDVLRYYEISYKIITPETSGNYDFPPVEVGYDSSTWLLPGNS